MSNDSKPGMDPYRHEYPYRVGRLAMAVKVAIGDLEAKNYAQALVDLRTVLAAEDEADAEHQAAVEQRRMLANSINSADQRHEGI